MERKLITAYVAADGKEFVTEAECIAYEKELEEQKRREEDERKRVQETKEKFLSLYTGIECIPSCEHDLSEDCWYFQWFVLNSDDDYNFICDHAFYGFPKPDQYPAYVCLEGESDPLDDDQLWAEYIVTLKQCISETKQFFKQFGLKVEFHKEEEN